MASRRRFLKRITTVGITGLASLYTAPVFSTSLLASSELPAGPTVISTWAHGLAANLAAFNILKTGGSAIDAVEAGVKISEADPEVNSVGLGGLPDRDGKVTLDACIMDEKGNYGAVMALEHILHPISVARMVMEKTPHHILAGEGALQFALENGFKKQQLLTSEAEARWKKWLNESKYQPSKIDIHNHDTIGMLAIDVNKNLSGACTTSGLAWKFHGRVGDSPVIGAGLYVDNEVGAACATGKGEAVLKLLGSFRIVEWMRQGMVPEKACRMAVELLMTKQPDHKEFQVGFLAINKKGQTGAFSIKKGFEFALTRDGFHEIVPSGYAIE
jgi:isoaspartyl peptidase/L-asparaginase-like protein (Ntn-hydrolase superfamily)